MQRKKARTPKTVQKGLEAAFRKRQNTKLREVKPRVMDLFERVLKEQLDSREQLSALFQEVSEQMSSLGVPLGGSEDWADRLFIEDKRGALLFSEEELDLAEEAQKRMEVMYNVDSWTKQLSARILSGGTLLAGGVDARRNSSQSGLTVEAILEGACKRLEDDMRYHASVFADASSARIFTQIEEHGLPNDLAQLGETLMGQCASMLPLAASALQALAASCAQLKLKAMRAAAAQKIKTSLERLRHLLVAPQLKPINVPARVTTILNEVAAAVEPMLPKDTADSDDDEYY